MTQYPLGFHVHPTLAHLGRATADRAAEVIEDAIATRGSARVMLAAAPSQSPTLTALADSDVDFGRVTFFHMDDYLGLAPDAPQGFGNWLEKHFMAHISEDATFVRMDPQRPADDARRDYAEALGDEPFDLTLCGLGVNAHLAFNDPPADLTDPEPVRVVTLDSRSRQQQVDEGHFPSMDDVPTQALTVTIPRLLNARAVVCSVLGAVKAEAVRNTLANEPTPDVPGTALKLHPAAELHVDRGAAGDE
jgi:6-phosphogluconolactonase/glucosamine-6-phosphate isomerase/deaminase